MFLLRYRLETFGDQNMLLCNSMRFANLLRFLASFARCVRTLSRCSSSSGRRSCGGASRISDSCRRRSRDGIGFVLIFEIELTPIEDQSL